MANLPQAFPQVPPSAIASYDYFDIAEGTGMKQFYLCTSEITGPAVDYHLVGNVIYSAELYLQFATASDIDFDLSAFNFPKTISGTGILQIAFRNAGASGTCYIICRLKKNDTVIVSIQSPTEASAAQGVWNMPITIPQTHFKKGDVLRLTIEGYQGGAGIASIGLDPMNREATGVMVITQSSIFIPFRSDI